MFFLTLRSILGALVIILLIHFLLTNFIYNEKKNKNKQKKKVIFKLPEEEQQENKNNKLKENNLRINNIKENNYEENLEEINEESLTENISENNKDENKEDFDNMKNDIMKYIEKNELYDKVKANDTKKEPVDSNFSTQLTDLNNYFQIEDSSNQLEKKNDKKLIPPQINLNTKKKIDIKNDDGHNINNSIQWIYKDESVMNGGELGNGLKAFDDFNNNLASI
jgi:cbb3-type cytochrome oxidase subunit 3